MIELGLRNDVYRRPLMTALDRLGLREGWRCVDVGAGGGDVSVALAEHFLAAGATIAVYDPQATATARAVLGDRISYHDDAYAAVDGADAVILVTEWPEFRALDLRLVKERMKGRVFVDGRNLYEPETLRALGFDYYGVGRGYAAQPFPADAEDLYDVYESNGGL